MLVWKKPAAGATTNANSCCYHTLAVSTHMTVDTIADEPITGERNNRDNHDIG